MGKLDNDIQENQKELDSLKEQLDIHKERLRLLELQRLNGDH